MVGEIVYITKEKKKELEQELIQLESVERKKILESLETAKALGDLSENAEYHQSREDQAKLEDRISEIKQILKLSIVISKTKNSGTVQIGSTVSLKKEGENHKVVYQIVGSAEAEMSEGKISNESPIGQVVLGKVKNDIVLVKGPNRVIKYKILDID